MIRIRIDWRITVPALIAIWAVVVSAGYSAGAGTNTAQAITYVLVAATVTWIQRSDLTRLARRARQYLNVQRR